MRIILLFMWVAAASAMAQTTAVPRSSTAPKKNSVAFPQRPAAAPAVLSRGRALYGVHCNFCHGSDARGGEGGPNLLRSQLVLLDQKGEALGPFIQQGRPAQGMPGFPSLSRPDLAALAVYIHDFPVDNRDPSRFPPLTIVVGNAKAGSEYFAAKCGSCHSVSGDLKGIGGKITDARVLQNTFLMPGKGGPKAEPFLHRHAITVTVETGPGRKVDGTLIRIDDFIVTLKDGDGVERTFRRDGDKPKVELHDPLQPHLDLLPVYTDQDIHNLTAYLVTLK